MSSTATTHDLFLDGLVALRRAGYGLDSPEVQSMFGSVADDLELIHAGLDAFKPVGAVAEMHLSGQGVKEHRTDAARFGLFVRFLSEAAKEVAKEAMGRMRMASDLLIEPVFVGSVGVRLVVPTKGDEGGTPEMVHQADAESDALRLIASLLTEADTSSLEPHVIAAVEGLPVRARDALAKALEQQVAAEWIIEGKVTQPGEEGVEFTSSVRGASWLFVELKRRRTTSSPRTAVGTVDGIKHSLRTMWFVEAGSDDSYPISIPQAEMRLLAAQFARHPEMEVRVDFTEQISSLAGSQEIQRKSRVLRSIEEWQKPRV